MPAEFRKDNPKDPSTSEPAVGELAPAEDFAPAATPEEIAQETIRKLQAEKKELMDRLLRKQAELDNFRKRTEREKAEFAQYTLFDAVKALLPILDGFKSALESDGSGEDYRKGVELIYQKFSDVLQKLGLRVVEAKGREFNPRLHEALDTIETDQYPEHVIVEELQPGYLFKDRLLRPSMVKVARRPGGHKNAGENVPLE